MASPNAEEQSRGVEGNDEVAMTTQAGQPRWMQLPTSAALPRQFAMAQRSVSRGKSNGNGEGENAMAIATYGKEG